MLASALKDSIYKYKEYKYWKYEKYETAYLIQQSSNKDGWCLFNVTNGLVLMINNILKSN